MYLDLRQESNACSRFHINLKLNLIMLQILTLSVLSILITAPIGAIAMTVTGQKLLQKSAVVTCETSDADGNEKIELSNDVGYV